MELIKESIDVPSFFLKSSTVWTSENFQNVFVHAYTSAKRNEKPHSMDSLDLQKVPPATNPHDFLFEDPDLFLEQLAGLMKEQMHGEEGMLLNDSSANYFFVTGKDGKNYSVLVRWEQSQQLWRCGAYLQEDLHMPNVRIFRSS